MAGEPDDETRSAEPVGGDRLGEESRGGQLGRGSWLFHIARAEDWEVALARGSYRPPGFEREGFIHGSKAHQVAPVADRLFRGAEGLLLLRIDPAAFPGEIRDEDLYGEGEEFPHLYGELPLEAVVEVLPLTPDPEAGFAHCARSLGIDREG